MYLKLLTRHAIKPGTRLTKIPHIRQIKSHTYHSITCTENAVVQRMTHLVSAIAGPKGPQQARSAHTRPKAARVSIARLLHLKLRTDIQNAHD